MATYAFRLKTLQKLRRAHRDHQRGRLTEAYRADELLEQRRAELAEQHSNLRRRQGTAFRATFTDAHRLVEADRYHQVLKERQQALDRQQAILSEEIEQIRQALLQADCEVRVLERLEDRGRDAHRREQLRTEHKQLDETAVQRAYTDTR